MSDFLPLVRLDNQDLTLVFDLRNGLVELAYIGPSLPESEDLATICEMGKPGLHQSQPDKPVPPSLFPQSGQGYLGTPALGLLRDGNSLPANLFLASVQQTSASIRFCFADQAARIAAQVHWWFEPSGLINSAISLTNEGAQPVTLLSLAALALPLPSWATHQTRFQGRWASEMQESRSPIAGGQSGGASFGGRPGFGAANWIRLEEAGVTETQGRVIAAHLAWSGDHILQLERDADGCACLMLGARLEAGEITLGASETYTTPTAVFAFSSNGVSGTRAAFHNEAAELAVQSKTPRKVHLNSWEALAFNLDLQSLKRLADDAAALGIERFVLDDGWFNNRRDDTSSLGDWAPDSLLFPDGLGPLIEHVIAAGMDFGLWVEPEMVSPDSDLYRNHPDWCLHCTGHPRATQRNQLVLDLTRPEVADYLFEHLDRLLANSGISYLKWDHNRDLFPLAGRGHAQTLALYGLLDRLRGAHPQVEIESCASGGGRIDFGILRRVSRFWASDNNDAIERLRINRGWLQFLPLRIIGNHVGPSPNPITGRRLSMDFRAKVALCGHMGVEADPAAMSDSERDTLARHIAIYKQWRNVLHSGKLTELESADAGVFGWFSWDGQQGLALAAQTRFADDFNAPPVRLPGLALEGLYRVSLIEPWPIRAAGYLPNQDKWRSGYSMSGRALAEIGLALPLHLPETAWLILVERVER